ncbi:olfactory receptor 148-like [Perca fluviatilis]|uniref:olfactory receptor 148-like n=1 Tax=Perca fluviatilis TaxID=8168 RepID=UPI001962FCE4|nr:olfactory receptor 148-like [Perca fluviatilis]
MENQTLNEDILLLEGLNISPQSNIPAFILLLLIYVFALVSNISLVTVIFTSRSLHQPMYLLFCNMSINDIFGATIVTPHVLRDIFIPHSERYIRYVHCAVQAFCVHLYASTTHTVLIIMAFDRYMAICNPLRYASVMTNGMVVKLSVSAWAVSFLSVSILVGLSVRLSRCRRVIPNPFCDNASLFNLSCENVTVNNIVGIGYTVLLLGFSVCCVSITYLNIAAVCVRSKNKALNSKALQTCSTHLAVYVFLLVSAAVIIALHRFPRTADYRKVVSVLCEATLPAFNAVIYGLQIKEIKQRIITLFHNIKGAGKK